MTRCFANSQRGEDDAALGTEGLRQRPGRHDVGGAGETCLCEQAATPRAGDAEPVGLVNDKKGVVIPRSLAPGRREAAESPSTA